MKLRTLAVVAALSSLAVAAHAAPGGDKPSAIVTPPPPTRISAELWGSVDIPEVGMTCGSPYSAAVNVTNQGTTVLPGKVVFTVGGAVKTQTFDVPPKETKKLVVMHDKALGCQGPLGLPKVEVFKGAASDKVASKTLTPKSFTAEKFFPQPPPGQVWIRRMAVSGACGQQAQGSADLFLLGAGQQTVQGDASFSGAPQFKPYTVVPNVPTTMKAGILVDCQGATGLPAFHSYLQNGASNVLLPGVVTFAPS